MHVAHVVYTPAKERQTVEPHAEGEALILIGVKPCVLEHIRVHHAGTHHLDPLAAQFFGCISGSEAHVYLDARLGKREEARPEAHFNLAFEKFLKKSFERALE